MSDSDNGDVSDSDESTAGNTAPARRLSAAAIATIVALPVAVIIFFVIVAVFKQSDDSYDTPLVGLPAPDAQSAGCTALNRDLPTKITGFDDRENVDGLVQWGAGKDQLGPSQVKCGVSRPTDLNPTSSLQLVNGVQWYFAGGTSSQARGTMAIAVDRRPYVAIWIPEESGNTTITTVSDIILRHFPAAPLDLGPLPSSLVPPPATAPPTTVPPTTAAPSPASPTARPPQTAPSR